MLPGFRFLFAAVALSVSILIFGLGAAALLRAAHEEFASNPSWRTAPEPPVLAQQPDTTNPVLAMGRVEQPPAPKPAEPVAADVRTPAPTDQAAAAQPATAATPA